MVLTAICKRPHSKIPYGFDTGSLLSRPIDKIKMTRSRGRWPMDLRRLGWFSCALLLEKSVWLASKHLSRYIYPVTLASQISGDFARSSNERATDRSNSIRDRPLMIWGRARRKSRKKNFFDTSSQGKKFFDSSSLGKIFLTALLREEKFSQRQSRGKKISFSSFPPAPPRDPWGSAPYPNRWHERCKVTFLTLMCIYDI